MGEQEKKSLDSSKHGRNLRRCSDSSRMFFFFFNFHPQAANTKGPFDAWVEGEDDKIHKSIEGKSA
jgi:hypothetical protein